MVNYCAIGQCIAMQCDGYRVDGPVRHQALEGATVEFVLHLLQWELSSANPQVHQSQQRTVCAAHRPREAPSLEPVYGLGQ